jgi:hypothetical protein
MRKNALPTGAAQPVTNTVERARAIFKDRAEPAAPQNERKNVRKAKAEAATEEAASRGLTSLNHTNRPRPAPR